MHEYEYNQHHHNISKYIITGAGHFATGCISQLLGVCVFNKVC